MVPAIDAGVLGGTGRLRREYLGKMKAKTQKGRPKGRPKRARQGRYFVMISGPMNVVGSHVDSHGI